MTEIFNTIITKRIEELKMIRKDLHITIKNETNEKNKNKLIKKFNELNIEIDYLCGYFCLNTH